MAQEAAAPTIAKVLYNMYEGDVGGRQLSETVEAFLARLPPLTTQLTTTGPWLYIGNPYTSHRPSSEHRREFITKGTELLEEFRSSKESIEASMAGKPKAIITRKLTPLRKKLETDLLAAAKGKGCTSGKWMLFPSPDRVNAAWSLVATATANDELGFAAKVATDGGEPERARLICIYTDDFENKADVKRVLERLCDMGLVDGRGAMGESRPIYYKADAYTYLDIMSGNEWGLKPTMYSSKDVLAEGK